MEDHAWPGQYKAAISFTMDNLGEAQDVNKGVWPAEQPIGSHYSVKTQIPRILDLLDKFDVKATYFAEAWSLDVYPDIVKEMSHRGHEIAWHGYQHETWSSLSPDEEKVNFQKSFEKASKHGVKYHGFRPPGGTINDRTFDLLHEYDISYVSPLGSLGVDRDIIVLPFEWKTVDAHYYMDKFSGIRKSLGDQEEVMSPGAFRDYLFSKISEVAKTHSYISILFHPFLQTNEEKFSVLTDVLERLSSDPSICFTERRTLAGLKELRSPVDIRHSFGDTTEGIWAAPRVDLDFPQTAARLYALGQDLAGRDYSVALRCRVAETLK